MLTDVREVDEIIITEWDAILDNTNEKVVYEDLSEISYLTRFINGRELIIGLFLILLGFLFYFLEMIQMSYWVFNIYIIFVCISLIILIIFDSMNIHGSYYIIGEKRVVKVPSGSQSPSKVFLRRDIDDIILQEDFVKFCRDGDIIRFPLSDNRQYTKFQDIFYGIS